MIKTDCLVCGKKQRLKVLFPATVSSSNLTAELFSARRIPDKIHYRIVRCQKCGMVFSSPVLAPMIVSQWYKQARCTYVGQMDHVANTYLKLFKAYRNLVPKKPRVVEVGCGTGFFLEQLRGLGVTDVYGVEPGESMVNQASGWLKRKIHVGTFKSGLFSANQFDAVFCFHTLDHMLFPRAFIKEAYKILKPGGLVLIVVHDSQGWSVKLWGEWSPIFDVEHIYLFDKQNLSAVFKRDKFEIIDVFDLVNTYPLEYWLKMSGLPRWVKSVGRWLNLPVSFKGGNIALVARKPR
jgi:SAM-dependent methyltransferase